MDSGLISTVIATVGGGLLGGGGAMLSHRSNTRTAARLIYAELARNSAAVAYFRQTGHWTAPALSRTAWDEQATMIARRRGSAAFVTVHQGYEALETVPALAAGGLGDTVRDRLLNGAVRQLVRALEEVAAIARIPPDLVREATGLLDGSHPAPAEETGALTWLLQGVVPLALQARLAPEDVARLVSEPAPLPSASEAAATEDADHVVYDAHHNRETTGLAVARRTGQPPTGDAAVDEAYDALLATSAFARAVLGRDPLVRRPMTAVVHYSGDFSNMYWNGELLVLGDGDGTVFERFTQCLEIIAGGVWMGVREMMSLFSHAGQSGALSVSICDVFGQLVKQYTDGVSVEDADWVVGKGLLAPGVRGVGLRSLKAPGTAYDDDVLGKDPQAAAMDDYVRTGRDNGGVHINSGIPGHAFYLVAERLGGYAWERAGMIWWDALTVHAIGSGLLFEDWARFTATAAVSKYGEGSVEHRAVLGAWERVGVRMPER
ncbi:M4 family metallopeptidase [Streptomyces sp. NPDC127108]|uniref:M4 family metallopeptidase n=1 Tax=Streptomyces sp. NPDC127108 TaxID=3345361 RepID=UPI0036396D2C